MRLIDADKLMDNLWGQCAGRCDTRTGGYYRG